MFPSFEQAFNPQVAAQAGFTHLLGDTKAHPAVSERLERRIAELDPSFHRHCRRVAAYATEMESDMTSHSALSSLRAATVLALSPSAPISARPQRLSRALPAQPSAIPVRANEQFASEGSLSPLPLQRKLAIGSSNDPLEAEAETVAARVVGVAPAAGPSVNSALQRFAATHRCGPASRGAAHRASGALHRWPPLDAHTRAFMEPRIGHDLSAVRIHTGPRAEESAQAVHALAYTVGQDTVFAAGQYNPQSAAGRSLLAHELSHTVQQAGGSAHSHLSSAAPALYRQSKPDTPPQQTAPQDTSNQKPKSTRSPSTFPGMTC